MTNQFDSTRRAALLAGVAFTITVPVAVAETPSAAMADDLYVLNYAAGSLDETASVFEAANGEAGAGTIAPLTNPSASDARSIRVRGIPGRQLGSVMHGAMIDTLGGVAVAPDTGNGTPVVEGTYAADALDVRRAPRRSPRRRSRTITAAYGGGFGTTLDVDADDERPGFDADTGGGYLGLRALRVAGGGLLSYGAVGVYSQSDFETEAGRTDIEAFDGGVFATYGRNRFGVGVSASYGRYDYETRRFLDGGDAFGDTDGEVFSAAVEVAYDLSRTLRLFRTSVQAYAGLEAIHSTRDGFTESVTGTAFDGVDYTTGYATAGVTVSRRLRTRGGSITPSLSVGYQHVFGDLENVGVNDLDFGGIDDVATVDENQFVVSTGVAFTSGRAGISFSYEGAFGENTEQHGGLVELAIRF